ncbi:MAG: circularly permuted type 2 ATP-grasp protein [Actinomycetota bacterium]
MSVSSASFDLDGYHPTPGLVDEVLTDGVYREHWERVGSAIGALGTAELQRRQEDVRRLLAADGATYRILDTDRTQAWKLDAIPLLLSSSEWAGIESGVMQRAVLLDLVLRDLYGEQKLLQRGVIPPEVVARDPGFVRPFHGVHLPDESQLFTYALDLGRDDEGRLHAVADYTQVPSGSGYALENRVVLARVFPSLYRDAQVHRVAPYFRALRTGLEALGEHRSETPRIVVFTPGARSETAFEHAYLASYLGYGLAEGGDLVAADGHVYLRTLGGRQRVDVILRRVDAAYSDPLELRPDSQLGVPGLLEACRRGNVVVVNTLGSPAIENPALNAFLPAVADALLGQELRLPVVPTWWCGRADDCRVVLRRAGELVFKPIDGAGRRRNGMVVGSELSAGELDALRSRIEADPGNWVAHETLALSTTPTLTSEGLRPRRTLLRTYAVARGGSFVVMAGGLTRVAPDEATAVISNQTGALAKDTWVLSSEPETPPLLSLGPGSMTPAVEDPVGALAERAAENLYWVGRYAERAESVVRLLRVVHDRRTDLTPNDAAGHRSVNVMLQALAIATYTVHRDSAQAEPPAPDNAEAELFSLACEPRRPGSLAFAVSRLLAAAEAVRDQLSIDTWQVTSSLERLLGTLSTTSPERQDVVQGNLGSVMQSLLALHGLAGESMVRDAGWHFMEAGRRIERFHHLTMLLRATLADERDGATDSQVLESVLVAAESIVTYRRRYRSRSQVRTLLDLLLADPDNPRSLRYQIDRLGESLDALPAAGAAEPIGSAQRLVLQLSTTIRLADTAALATANDDGVRTELVTLCDELLSTVERAALAIAEGSFAPPRRQRVLGEREAAK